ncbi:MAG TPA: universal stress protein [Longimicrobium sp.]|nr:universal stress protein [Longimicrobium sp.]
MTPPIRRLLAGVATLHPDDPALGAALGLAARAGAALQLVHVLAPEAAHAVPPALSRGSALRGVVERASPGATSGGRVTCRAVVGTPERVLRGAAVACCADLLVLGATRRGALAGAVLGTTAGRVLRSARTPMLVVRGPLPDRPLRVLLTTDLSHHAVHAHARGLALARGLGGPEPELRTLFVQPPELGGGYPVPLPWEATAEHELVDFLDAEVPRVRSTPRIRAGEPAYEIVREAREWQADVIVLGTHGRRGARRVFLGSVAETVLRHAPCACLVVPPVRLYSMEMETARAAAGGALAGIG